MGEGPFPGQSVLLPNSALQKYLITQLVRMPGICFLNINLLFKEWPQYRQNYKMQLWGWMWSIGGFCGHCRELSKPHFSFYLSCCVLHVCMELKQDVLIICPEKLSSQPCKSAPRNHYDFDEISLTSDKHLKRGLYIRTECFDFFF